MVLMQGKKISFIFFRMPISTSIHKMMTMDGCYFHIKDSEWRKYLGFFFIISKIWTLLSKPYVVACHCLHVFYKEYK